MANPNNSISQAAVVAEQDQTVTGFYLRAQVSELLFGEGDFGARFGDFLTTSRSRFNIRKRFLQLFALDLDNMVLEESIELFPGITKSELIVLRKALEAKLQKERLTSFHMGIIADGNRRAAEERGLPGKAGHLLGAKVLEEKVFPFIAEIPEITELSVYILSKNNIDKRDPDEVNNIFRLFSQEFDQLMTLARKSNVRYRHAGSKVGLSDDLNDLFARMEKQTEQNTGTIINLCINYDSQIELGQAIRRMYQEISAGEIAQMSNAEIAQMAEDRYWVPRCDVILRTGGGGHRGSGFMINRASEANCHLRLLETKLPDLAVREIYEELLAFAGVERRMGK